MPASSRPAPATALAAPPITTDALAVRVGRAPRLGLLTRASCYLAGRTDGARTEWALQRGTAPDVIAWHWHERNNRGFQQAALQRRIELERAVAPAGRELRHLLRSVDFAQEEVDISAAALVEHDLLDPITPSTLVRAPGELRMREDLVVSRRERRRRSERDRLAAAHRTALDRLIAEEERIAELRAVIGLAIHRAIGEIEQLRAFFGRRAEVAARGLTNRSAAAASALGLLHGVASLERPAWVASLETDLLPGTELVLDEVL